MIRTTLTVLSLLLLFSTLTTVSYVISPLEIHKNMGRGKDKTSLVSASYSDKKCLSSSECCKAKVLNSSNSRRNLIVRVVDWGRIAVLVGGVALPLLAPTRVDASYSAYTARENDWLERQAKGEVKISSSKDLRKQLREIAPMNDDTKSKIFCPNGQSSAVSPLMENKCDDRLAMPSVYGRTQDIAENSIPGFTYTNGGSPIEFPKYKP